MTLQQVCENLDGYPMRVIKFGGEKDHSTDEQVPLTEVLMDRARSVMRPSRARPKGFQNIAEGWTGQSGSTYCWKMIETDVLQHYRAPAVGKGGGQQGDRWQLEKDRETASNALVLLDETSSKYSEALARLEEIEAQMVRQFFS